MSTPVHHLPAPDLPAPDLPAPEAAPPDGADPAPPDSSSPPGAGEFPGVHLQVLLRMIEQAARGDDAGLSEGELVDQIAQLESLGNAVAALQANRIRTFGRVFVAAHTTPGGVEPEKLERSVVAQIGLACRVSPTVARGRLRTARDLRAGLDHVRGLFAAGELSREKAAAVVTGTEDLDPDQRARVDADLAERDLTGLGIGRLRDLVRTLVARAASETFRARAVKARTDRRVTLRPGEHGMCWLTAHLPIEQGAACMAALSRAVKDLWADASAVVTRSRGQVMADTLVERTTGQATAEAVNVEIQALVPVEALIDPGSPVPAVIPGHGPIPADHLLSGRAGRRTLRRLVTRDGIVIGGDSRQRGFTGVLADLLRARDGHRCREPYCDAPIRHSDHIDRHTDGGPTSLTNGRGVCEFHNYIREQPGWSVHTTPEGIRTTTPTGHTYLSPVPRVA